MKPPVDAEALSSLLYDVYSGSRQFRLGEFQPKVLERLRPAVGFDSAWWGIGSERHELLSSYVFDLPGTFDAEWDRVKHQDTLWDRSRREDGRSISVEVTDRRFQAGLCAFSRQFRINHVLTVSSHTMRPRGAFLSFYRGPDSPPFTRADCRLVELLMPHLVSAWAASWEASLSDNSRLGCGCEAACGVFDSCGGPLAVQEAFFELLRLEWPQCRDSELPSPVRALVAAGDGQVGREVSLRSTPVLGLRLVEIRRRSRLDVLTPRERLIADLYGEGRSYRDIAAALGIAGNTVRHHLREMYLKLSISDKAELARLVGFSAGNEARRGRSSQAPAG